MSIEVGEIVEGKITSITNFGAFVALDNSTNGMIHISEVSNTYVKDISSFLKVGQDVKVKVCSIDEKGRIALSLKKANDETNENKSSEYQGAENEYHQKKKYGEMQSKKEKSEDAFEDMMSKFMKTSNEKISDLKKTMDSKRSNPGFSRKSSKKF